MTERKTDKKTKTPESIISDFQEYILTTTNEKHSEYELFNSQDARDLIMDELADLLDSDSFTREDAARISALFYFLLLTPDD